MFNRGFTAQNLSFGAPDTSPRHECFAVMTSVTTAAPRSQDLKRVRASASHLETTVAGSAAAVDVCMACIQTGSEAQSWVEALKSGYRNVGSRIWSRPYKTHWLEYVTVSQVQRIVVDTDNFTRILRCLESPFFWVFVFRQQETLRSFRGEV